MSGAEPNPAPQSDALSPGLIAFMLFTGPLSWFVQFCVGFGLTSWPCFPKVDRRVAPVPGFEWTGTATMVLTFVCVLLSLAAGLVSWRKLREVAGEKTSSHAHMIETGHGRTHFVALWGTVLGFSFAFAALVSMIGFAMVPRCLG